MYGCQDVICKDKCAGVEFAILDMRGCKLLYVVMMCNAPALFK